MKSSLQDHILSTLFSKSSVTPLLMSRRMHNATRDLQENKYTLIFPAALSGIGGTGSIDSISALRV